MLFLLFAMIVVSTEHTNNIFSIVYLQDCRLKDPLVVDKRLCLPVARRNGHDSLGVRKHAVAGVEERPRRQQHALPGLDGGVGPHLGHVQRDNESRRVIHLAAVEVDLKEKRQLLLLLPVVAVDEGAVGGGVTGVAKAVAFNGRLLFALAVEELG